MRLAGLTRRDRHLARRLVLDECFLLWRKLPIDALEYLRRVLDRVASIFERSAGREWTKLPNRSPLDV
jgi:hypothetical protein